MDYQDEGEEIINNQFNQICDIMLKTKLKSFTSSLEMVYFNGPKYRELTNETLFPVTSKICHQKLKSNLAQIKSISAKLEWIKILRFV
jgi:hypothetical protein